LAASRLLPLLSGEGKRCSIPPSPGFYELPNVTHPRRVVTDCYEKAAEGGCCGGGNDDDIDLIWCQTRNPMGKINPQGVFRPASSSSRAPRDSAAQSGRSVAEPMP